MDRCEPLLGFLRASHSVATHIRHVHYRVAFFSEGTWWGVDIDSEGICNTMDRGVWEPVTSKTNSIASATEAACLILSVDETVRNPQSEKPEGGPAMRGGMGGMGGAKPMSAALGGRGLGGMMRGGRGVRVMQGRGGK